MSKKNRFKTTEQLMGFDDEQHSTPKHDAMQLWLLNENNLFNKLNFNKFLPQTDPKHGRSLKKYEIKAEFPIKSAPKFIGGYGDVVVSAVYHGLKPFLHIIEVKPTIRSFGEVLRQINSYAEFIEWDSKFSAGYMYLFTAETKYDEQFKGQGITVLHPPVSVDKMINMYL